MTSTPASQAGHVGVYFCDVVRVGLEFRVRVYRVWNDSFWLQHTQTESPVT